MRKSSIEEEVVFGIEIVQYSKVYCVVNTTYACVRCFNPLIENICQAEIEVTGWQSSLPLDICIRRIFKTISNDSNVQEMLSEPCSSVLYPCQRGKMKIMPSQIQKPMIQFTHITNMSRIIVPSQDTNVCLIMLS